MTLSTDVINSTESGRRCEFFELTQKKKNIKRNSTLITANHKYTNYRCNVDKLQVVDRDTPNCTAHADTDTSTDTDTDTSAGARDYKML